MPSPSIGQPDLKHICRPQYSPTGSGATCRAHLDFWTHLREAGTWVWTHGSCRTQCLLKCKMYQYFQSQQVQSLPRHLFQLLQHFSFWFRILMICGTDVFLKVTILWMLGSGHNPVNVVWDKSFSQIRHYITVLFWQRRETEVGGSWFLLLPKLFQEPDQFSLSSHLVVVQPVGQVLELKWRLSKSCFIFLTSVPRSWRAQLQVGRAAFRHRHFRR